MKKIITLLVILLMLGAILAVGGYYLNNELVQISSKKVTRDQIYTLKKGSSLRSIYDDFFPKEHVNNLIFRLWQKQHANLANVKSGTYEIVAGSNFEQILKVLVDGKEKSYSISFIEGGRIKQILKLLKSNKYLVHTLKDDISHKELSELVQSKYEYMEGLFLPDTYAFNLETADVDILKRAYEAMDKFLMAEYEKRDQDLPYKDAYEALIMASIIEKETAISSERPIIASVFINRLKKGMKLQTDPTVIYGVGDRYKGKVYKSFLTDKNSYNTYVIDGLPPTPIATVSRASIVAALHPAKTDYLYFVAKGPNSRKGHVFSKTSKEHEKAVAIYRKAVKEYKQQAQQEKIQAQKPKEIEAKAVDNKVDTIKKQSSKVDDNKQIVDTPSVVDDKKDL